MKTTSADSEKKFQRKLSEMKEIQQLDQQAKMHMEESFRLSLEEKDEKINVMQMQVGDVCKGERERERERERESERVCMFIHVCAYVIVFFLHVYLYTYVTNIHAIHGLTPNLALSQIKGTATN